MTNINTLKYLPMSIQIIKCIISIISEDIILYRALGVDSARTLAMSFLKSWSNVKNQRFNLKQKIGHDYLFKTFIFL